MATAYYNEHDLKAAEWLRELIRAGAIAPGEVDTRSIEDVSPSDLRGYAQCHFFAGIGGWPLALRLAGWPDDRAVWTGSCPCQPFSAAGKGNGFDDERHLWPAWFQLIAQCGPPTVFGEQVASKDGLGWLDLVCADLEAAGYAFGAADLCAAGVGAPHIRQRLWFVADREGERSTWGHGIAVKPERQGAAGLLAQSQHGGLCWWDSQRAGAGAVMPPSPFGVLAHSSSARLEGCNERALGQQREATERSGSAGALANTDGGHPSAERQQRSGQHGQQPAHGGPVRLGDANLHGAGRHAGTVRGQVVRPDRQFGSNDACASGPFGFWSNADWLPCRDGKARPVEPGSFPLAHGVSGRVGLLRGYGNAIVPQVAAQWIGAYLDVTQ